MLSIRLRPEIRKAQILESAKKQLELKGYQKLTVPGIVKSAGISQGSFYRYFKNVDDIVITLIKRGRIFLRLFFLFILISVCISQSLYATDDWKLVKSTDGVEVYTRPYKNSNIDEYKGTVTISASIDILYAMIFYPPLHKKYFHTCYDSFLVRSGVYCLAFKAPWPYWNRDLIYEYFARLDHETGNIVITGKVVQDTSVPVKEKTVRITDSDSTWILEKLGPDKTRVTYRNYTDLKVKAPKTIINIINQDTAFYSLINMRNLAKEPVYKKLPPKYDLPPENRNF